MNWLDNAIHWLSPEAGVRRMRARRVAQIIQLAYEGAKTGRRTEGWITSGSSANAEIATSLTLLRQRSHALIRDDPHASRVCHEFVRASIGTGIMARTQDEQVADAWSRFTDECDADGQLDLYGIQGLIAQTVFESGECLVRFRQRRDGDGLTIPLQLQVLEPDYLDLSKTQTMATGYIVQGVEFDLIGRRTYYWLFGNHPGEVTQTSTRGALASARVPASEVLHIYRKDRPGQVRGVPWLAPIMLLMRDLGEYEDAELMRKKVEACFVGFITSPEGMDGGPIGARSTDAITGQRKETVEPGMLEYGKPGESITFGAPHNVGGYGEYVTKRQQSLAAGVDMMYSQLSGDYSQINYTAHKAGFLSFRGGIEGFRWLTFIPMFCNPLWARFCLVADAAGRIPPGPHKVNHTPPGFGSVEPYREAMASVINTRTARRTLFQEIAETGEDPMTQLKEIQRINKLLDEMGIILDCDPRKVTQSGAEQTEQAGQKPSMGGH